MHDKEYLTPVNKSNSDYDNRNWNVVHSQTFESMLSGKFKNPENGNFWAVRRTPTRQATLEADVLVPLAQSLVWSIVAMLPTISVSMWLRWEWSAPLFIGATSILVSWISAMRRSENSLMKTEEFSYSATQGGSKMLSYFQKQRNISLEVVHETSGIRNRMQILDLPAQITETEFTGFLIDVLAGSPLSRRNWTGPGKPFSRDVYDILIERLLDASIIKPSPNGGKILTNGGRHAIAALQREGVIS